MSGSPRGQPAWGAGYLVFAIYYSLFTIYPRSFLALSPAWYFLELSFPAHPRRPLQNQDMMGETLWLSMFRRWSHCRRPDDMHTAAAPSGRHARLSHADGEFARRILRRA